MVIVSYVRECKAFCEYASEERLSDNEVVLWHALFNLFNLRAASNDWPEGFLPMSNAKVLSLTPWGSGDSAVEKLRRTRDKLLARGLIAYEAGERRRKAPLYAMKYFHPVFTPQNVGKGVGNREGNGVGKGVGNREDIKDKDIDPDRDFYPDEFPDFVPDTHIQASGTANSAGARAGWFDPRNPENEDDEAWLHSERTRAAVAQRILAWAVTDARLARDGEDTHTLLCDLMAAGMHPSVIVESTRGCRGMAAWENVLLRRAHVDGLDLGPLRGERYELRRTRGLDAQSAVIVLREREKMQEALG